MSDIYVGDYAYLRESAEGELPLEEKQQEELVERDMGEEQALLTIKAALNQLNDTISKWGRDVQQAKFNKLIDRLDVAAGKLADAIYKETGKF